MATRSRRRLSSCSTARRTSERKNVHARRLRIFAELFHFALVVRITRRYDVRLGLPLSSTARMMCAVPATRGVTVTRAVLAFSKRHPRRAARAVRLPAPTECRLRRRASATDRHETAREHRLTGNAGAGFRIEEPAVRQRVDRPGRACRRRRASAARRRSRRCAPAPSPPDRSRRPQGCGSPERDP